ncbi:hypothetical protein BP5796_09992 [Coleophoma crateriformis]|uniref:Orotidine 5'-phosphate decarboxylase n=1 Tax=Coleophoma crateriformis TaxID=565419 RepID=A0A3D8QUG7_9HELO|nr:hypothetical protein BP5796_09992 [Coleophoma crateriformis]
MASPPPEDAAHPLTTYLQRLIAEKHSNLCVSADITCATSMLSLAEAVGPSIVVFKTHADILAGWDSHPTTGTGAQLAALARKHRFLIFEDRKFADIGSTCQLQYVGGLHQIVTWAHIVNAHILPGKDMVRALGESAAAWEALNVSAGGIEDEAPSCRGLLLLAQMSSAGNFLDETYTSHCVAIAREQRDFVMGYIAQRPLNSLPGDAFVTMTPGCSIPPQESLDDSEFVPGEEDPLGQQYNTPRDIMLRGCDVIIVGRGICNAKDPKMKAEQYRKLAWDAYVEKREKKD